jgi:hypothetical protein
MLIGTSNQPGVRILLLPMLRDGGEEEIGEERGEEGGGGGEGRR